ncbi:MAG: HEAT repeat domain-containing protein [Acidobacteriota bacterium]|jgi:HEAT repeat protein|nr:HEAT repeat domain-containing protein [Acidobacteriota bacterium]
MGKRIIGTIIAAILFTAASMADVHGSEATTRAGKYLQHEKNNRIRAEAIRLLKDCAEPECRQMLVSALDDPYWVVRVRAVRMLKPEPELTPQFIRLLSDPDDIVWDSAVRVLRSVGAPAHDALVKASASPEAFVRQGAIIALFGNQNWYFNNLGFHAYIENICSDQVRPDDEVFSILRRAGKDENVHVRETAQKLLACYDAMRTNSRTQTPGAADVDKVTDETRIRDLRARPKETILFYADNRSLAIRREVFRMAEKITDRKLLGELAQKLLITYDYTEEIVSIWRDALKNSRHAEIRRMVAGAIGGSIAGDDGNRDEMLYGMLKEFINDKDLFVRVRAASSGGVLGDRSVQPVLERLLANSNKEIHDRAVYGLAELMPASYEFLRSKIKEMRWEDVRRIGSVLSQRVVFSKERSALPDDREKSQALLLAALENPDSDAIAYALRYLYELDKDVGYENLTRLLPIADVETQIKITKLFRTYSGDGRPKKLFLELAGDAGNPEELRIQAVEQVYIAAAEGIIDQGIKDGLLALLRDSRTSRPLRQAVFEKLDFKDLLRFADACELAVQKMPRKFVENDNWRRVLSQNEFLEILRDPETAPPCRAAMIGALDGTAEPEGVELLIATSGEKDPAIRAVSAIALGKTGASTALPVLENLSLDPSEDVREKAAAAIKAIEATLAEQSE